MAKKIGCTVSWNFKARDIFHNNKYWSYNFLFLRYTKTLFYLINKFILFKKDCLKYSSSCLTVNWLHFWRKFVLEFFLLNSKFMKWKIMCPTTFFLHFGMSWKLTRILSRKLKLIIILDYFKNLWMYYLLWAWIFLFVKPWFIQEDMYLFQTQMNIEKLEKLA